MANLTALDALLHEVCAGKGWCGSVIDGQLSHVTDYFPEAGQITADQFVAWLFAANGVDPNENWAKWQSHYNGLRDAFVRHMGSEMVVLKKSRGAG